MTPSPTQLMSSTQLTMTTTSSESTTTTPTVLKGGAQLEIETSLERQQVNITTRKIL